MTETTAKHTATYAPILAAVSRPQDDGSTLHDLTLVGTDYTDELDKWKLPEGVVLTVGGYRLTRFSLYYYGPAGTAYNEHGPGKHATGPLAYVIAQASVLSATPQRQPVEIAVNVGDVLRVRGERFRVVKARQEPVLEHITN